jgi:DNA-binding XRE family transcriptional regulator
MGEVIMFPRRDNGSQTENESRLRPRRLPGWDDVPGKASASGTRETAGARQMLWREAAGHALREERLRQSRTQGDVADAAGVSTQYLSEVERGRKEPSSEILDAVTGALGLGLIDLTSRVTRTLSSAAVNSPMLSAA